MSDLKINDIIVLTVRKLVYEGKGLCDFNGFKIFIDGVLPQEKIKAQIIKINKNYGFAKIIDIIEPSKHRIKPFCPLFNACGGCCWQFIEYNEQLIQKTKIIENIFPEIKILPTIQSPENNAFRHKIQMNVSQTKNSKRFLIGYFKENSHEIVNIKYCPIQKEIINEIIEFIREKASELGILAYNEKKHSGELRHIIFRQSSFDESILLTFIVNNQKVSDNIRSLSQKIYDEFELIKGICINFNDKKTNTIFGKKSQKIFGNDFISENLNGISYKIASQSFFQTNPNCAVKLFDVVKKYASNFENPSILDAYCGGLSIGLYLKDIAKNVLGIEESTSNVIDAKENIKLNNVKNFEVIEGDAKEIFKNLINQKKFFDIVLLDPPRKGCEPESLDFASLLAKKAIIYISCNPMSLKRDWQILKEKGFTLKEIQPVDMFCHSYHIESVALFEK